MLGLSEGEGFDRGHVRKLLLAIDGSGLDRVALVGQDGVHDSAGRPDDAGTHRRMPADSVFAVCALRPERLRPCPSIHRCAPTPSTSWSAVMRAARGC
jgi:hypothetical protein